MKIQESYVCVMCLEVLYWCIEMCDDFNLQKFNQFLASRKNKDVDMDKEKPKEREENVTSKSGMHKIPKIIIRQRSQSGPREVQIEKKALVKESGDHGDDKIGDNKSIDEESEQEESGEECEEGDKNENEEVEMSTVEEGGDHEEVQSTDTTRWQDEEQRIAEKSLTDYEKFLAAIEKGKEEAASKSKSHELRKSKDVPSIEEDWFEEDDDEEEEQEEVIEYATSKRKG